MNTKLSLLLIAGLTTVAVLFPQVVDNLPGSLKDKIAHADQLQKELPEWVLNSFQNWKLEHSKRYASAEVELYRMAVYYANFLHIQAENARQSEYELGPNQFMDLTPEEWQAQYLIAPPADYKNSVVEDPEAGYTVPNGSVDWQSKNVVGPVLDQGSCGSCWAFSATETVQSYIGIKEGTVPQLSEQQLVDCTTSYGNEGCNGGWPSYALNYVKANGQATSSQYPYTGRDGKCKLNGGSAKINGVTTSSGCNALISNLAVQPTSVCVDASNWSFYRSGVFSNCATEINHAVLAIGYDTNGNWIIRNSWGSSWGQSGNINLKSGDTCAVCQVLANVN